MKFKAILTTLAVALSAAFADTPADTADFNVLHGNSYSYVSYTNELTYYSGSYHYNLPSLAPTVIGLINTPYRIQGRNFVYLDPSRTYGAAAYTTNDKTTFLSIETGGSNSARATLGIATKNIGFSFTMDNNDHLEFFEEKSPYYKSETTTFGASTWNTYQLRLAIPFSSIDLNTRFMFTRSNANDSLYQSTYKDHDGEIEKIYDTHHFTLWGEAIISNTPSAKNFFWRAEVSAMRHNHATDSTYKNSFDPDEDYDYVVRATGNYTYIDLAYAFSVIALRSPNARLHLGAITLAEAQIKDFLRDRDNHRKDNYICGWIELIPSMTVEYAFNENWMIWGGATMTWNTAAKWEKYTENWKTDYKVRNNLLGISTETDTPSARTGVRFNYKQIMLESGVSTTFYRNPFRGFDDATFLYSVSGLVNF